MRNEQIEIEHLYLSLIDKGYEIVHNNTYELIYPENIDILTDGNRYVRLVAISRHKTEKHLVSISINTKGSGQYDVVVTTDHVCMIYNRDHFFENINAKNLSIGDYVEVYDEVYDKEVIGTISDIKDLGITEDYVYDCEVDDNSHAFYANDVLIHNSQFIDLSPVTNSMIQKYQLPEKIDDWTQEKRQELWNTMSDFTNEKVNTFVRDLVHEKFQTENQNVLTYELEYMVDVGLYESMKHYFVRKIFEEGDAVNKVKVTGISLKQNQTDKSMKDFLKDIYEGVVLHDWSEEDYQDYINKLYARFKTFTVDQVAFWKGYGTARDSVGFLQMAKGATGISKAATYYNQILNKLGLGKKYDELRVGDKCRFLYVKDNNPYGINVLAYKPGQWPKEFNSLFEVDYSVMFDKIILDQLKRFREALHFENQDPRKQVVQDIFDL